MSHVDLIQRLREAGDPRNQKLGPSRELYCQAADLLASKDTALAEIRAELEEAKRLYDVQIAGHRLSAKEATTNLIRATKAEAELEMWREVKHSSHWQARAEAAESELARVAKALVIANAQLADMEFLSIEGFMGWKQDRASRSISQDGEERSK